MQELILQVYINFKTQGKASPGPVYNVRGGDQFYYKKDADTKFGTDARNTLNTGAKFDYYQRKDVDVNCY